jgi:hypothetical protein
VRLATRDRPAPSGSRPEGLPGPSFSFASVIELVCAILVLGRLRAELGGGRPNELAERRVLRIIAVTCGADLAGGMLQHQT